MDPFRSKTYTDAARDRKCVFCGTDDGTTVAAHLRLKGFCGTGTKPHDFMVTDACWECHDKLDGRIKTDPPWQNDFERMLIGLCRTLARRFEDGVLIVEDDE